jgi:hypothetical protein
MIFSKIASISDSEGIPAYNLYLKHPMIDSTYLLIGLLLVENLSLSPFFLNLRNALHSFNFGNYNVVSVLIRMLYSIQEGHQSFLFV